MVCKPHSSHLHTYAGADGRFAGLSVVPERCLPGQVKIKPECRRCSLPVGNLSSIELLPEMNWLQGPCLLGITL